MLTPYDEFPVHQSSRPFSELPVSDFSWDDGYYFGVASADAGVFLFTGLRISQNSDVIGGYAGVNVRGRQYTVRLSRVWRPDFSTSIGPLSVEFVRPLELVRLRLADSTAALQFDLEWEGVAPPYLESHHTATSRGRCTTDQSRYVQVGAAHGWIALDGERFEVGDRWFASRDHSWGLYAPRKPLGDPSEWLPPPPGDEGRRALRWWMPFRTDDHVGFYHFHEGPDGTSAGLNDVFGTPFEGWIDVDGERLALVDVEHALRFLPDTRALSGGQLTLTDAKGRRWVHEVELASPPWFPATIGYYQGSWRDGGTIATYHADPSGVYVECDDYDFAVQPFDLTLPTGHTIPGLHGMEHLVRLHSTRPDGRTSEGVAQVELFIEGRYAPYGFA